MLTHQIICVAVGSEGIPEKARHNVNLVVKSGRESVEREEEGVPRRRVLFTHALRRVDLRFVRVDGNDGVPRSSVPATRSRRSLNRLIERQRVSRERSTRERERSFAHGVFVVDPKDEVRRPGRDTLEHQVVAFFPQVFDLPHQP